MFYYIIKSSCNANLKANKILPCIRRPRGYKMFTLKINCSQFPILETLPANAADSGSS